MDGSCDIPRRNALEFGPGPARVVEFAQARIALSSRIRQCVAADVQRTFCSCERCRKSFTPEREAFLIFSRKARHVILRNARRGCATDDWGGCSHLVHNWGVLLVVCFHSDAPGLAMHQRVDAMEGVCRRVLAVSQCMLVTALTRFRKFLFSMC
jgi:hypothetical protein